MSQGILEQHKVHFLCGVGLVVEFHQFVDSSSESIKIIDSFIHSLSFNFNDTIFIDNITSQEITEEDGFLALEFLDDITFELREAFKGDILDIVDNSVFILLVDELINKDSFTFMPPETQEINFLFHVSDCACSQNNIFSNLEHTLEDSGQISEIENVMELIGSGQKSLFNLVPDSDGSISQVFNDSVKFSRVIFGLESVLDNGSINTIDIVGQNHIEDKVLSLQSVGNIISTTSRMIHSTNELEVNNLFE
mmetsp:Transcript_28826/g.26103  ORF Transcript_28826/g.26103 Transcript_28826/m.26103 type:complete len:251 (+) Transcript_28826:1050-1802(+)